MFNISLYENTQYSVSEETMNLVQTITNKEDDTFGLEEDMSYFGVSLENEEWQVRRAF